MTDTPPTVKIKSAGKRGPRGASLIWLIPILAMVVAFGVAWQSFVMRGPLIVVEFLDGAGIAAGETKLKYRDIEVGEVEEVTFGNGLEKVQVHIRLKKDIAPYVDDTSVFWIVEPEVTAQGVTGLSTVLSGVYIEGSWDSEIGDYTTVFRGSEEAPLIKPGDSGLQIAFRTTTNGSLTDNAPIMFRGIQVGQVGRAQIARSGAFAITEGLIYEEHRHLINSSTRFWEESGFTFSVSAQGAEIDFSSLATLLGGGITFDTFVSGGDTVRDGEVFEVFEEKEAARSSLFTTSAVDPLQLSVIFEENISGLAVGAPVELSGFRIGSVESLSGLVDFNQFGDSRVRLNVILSLQPARLGLPGDVSAETALRFLQSKVADGLRARLASASLLTGGLKVEFVEVEDAPPARLTAVGAQLPVMPTTAGDTAGSTATVEGVFNRINELPIEELLNSAIGVMNSANALISNGDLQDTPGDLRALLGDLSALVTSEDVQNIPVSLNATLSRVEELVAQLEQQQIAVTLGETLKSASDAAAAVTTSMEGVPALIAELETVAGNAAKLDLEALMVQVTGLTTSAQTLLASNDVQQMPADVRKLLSDLSGLVSSDAVQSIPTTVNGTLTRVDGMLSELEQQRVTEKLGKALASAAEAADAVSASVEGVPALVTEIQSVASRAAELEFDTLIKELTTLTTSAEALVSSPETAQLPAALSGALDQLNATLRELREGGAVANVNQTLASARTAADSIASSANDLPQVIARLNTLFVQAGRTIEGYNQGEQLSRSADAALREIQQAAKALEKLARTIERNPNSLLLGR
ncbi:MlaD family protein [Sulfitobacter sp. HNIBRBA2951]|uniref:MlaD family protein n=1 Tax=Sulfitobacter aquimarinus TaxID=3158557 RepID=UPI0032E05392